MPKSGTIGAVLRRAQRAASGEATRKSAIAVPGNRIAAWSARSVLPAEPIGPTVACCVASHIFKLKIALETTLGVSKGCG